MKMKFILICGLLLSILAFMFVFSDNSTLIAGRGCCSRHGGVCGCSGGRAKCCDGTLSPSCQCFKDDVKLLSCKN